MLNASLTKLEISLADLTSAGLRIFKKYTRVIKK